MRLALALLLMVTVLPAALAQEGSAAIAEAERLAGEAGRSAGGIAHQNDAVIDHLLDLLEHRERHEVEAGLQIEQGIAHAVGQNNATVLNTYTV